MGNQDTLYLYGAGNRDGQTVTENAHIRFDDCYVEGTTDFIFGSAAALFRRCEIRSKADSYVDGCLDLPRAAVRADFRGVSPDRRRGRYALLAGPSVARLCADRFC